MTVEEKKKYDAAKLVLTYNRYEDINEVYERLKEIEEFLLTRLSQEDIQLMKDSEENLNKILEHIQQEAASEINQCFKKNK